MEVRGYVMCGRIAIRAVWIEQYLGKAVCRAGDHRAPLPGGEIDDRDFEAMTGILEGHSQHVARVIKERIAVWGEGRGGRAQGTRWTSRYATPRDECEVDILLSCRIQTGIVVGRILVVVDGQAVDIEGRAPLGGVTDGAAEADPTRWVKLHFNERGAGVFADVVRLARVGASKIFRSLSGLHRIFAPTL